MSNESRRAGPSLSGLRAVVTRPTGQAEELLELLRGAGADPMHFPTIAIEPVPHGAPALDRIADYDLVVFVSRNAVLYGAARVTARGAWPAGIRIAAVGRATAEALAETGRPADLIPARDYSSEGLLALPELEQVAGHRVLIVRGQGGRELLAQTLTARGATVDYAEVYRRVCPDIDPGPLRQRVNHAAVDLLVVTSREGLENLFAIMGTPFATMLRKIPLVVISEALMKSARSMGVAGDVIVATEATDLGLVRAIEAWARTRGASERR